MQRRANALTEAARRFFSPDTAAPQPARREVSATAEAFGDGSREEPAEEAIPAEPEVLPEAAEAAEAEAPAPEPQAVEPEPGEKELEVPAEPDHEYIDEIIRRMAQKQAQPGRRRKQPVRQRRAVVPQPAAEPAAPQESLEPAAPAAVQPERSYVFPSITLLNARPAPQYSAGRRAAQAECPASGGYPPELRRPDPGGGHQPGPGSDPV